MRDQNPFASWPAAELAWKLIAAYFDRVNLVVPLLHRPTFESCVPMAHSFLPAGFH
jgi:hypothetical protein